MLDFLLSPLSLWLGCTIGQALLVIIAIVLIIILIRG